MRDLARQEAEAPGFKSLMADGDAKSGDNWISLSRAGPSGVVREARIELIDLEARIGQGSRRRDA